MVYMLKVLSTAGLKLRSIQKIATYTKTQKAVLLQFGCFQAKQGVIEP